MQYRVRIAAALTLIGLFMGCSNDPRDLPITPRATVARTPTAEPLPSATRRPPPTPSRTPLPRELWITNAGRDGVILRATPVSGERVGGLTNGIRLVPLGDQEIIDGRVWVRVRDQDNRVGWVSAEFVSATPPATPGAATATPSRVPTRTP